MTELLHQHLTIREKLQIGPDAEIYADIRTIAIFIQSIFTDVRFVY